MRKKKWGIIKKMYVCIIILIAISGCSSDHSSSSSILPAIDSAKTISSTEVEVTFNKNITADSIQLNDFEFQSFDNGSSNGQPVSINSNNGDSLIILTLSGPVDMHDSGEIRLTSIGAVSDGAKESEQISWVTVDYGNWTITTSPAAEFSATPSGGNPPLTVGFTDQSTNNPTSWEWDFDNDGTTDSTDQNPSYVFNSEGNYTVVLTVANAQGSDTETKSNYIYVTNSAYRTFYIAPSENGGNDDHSGLYEDQPWATFSHAMEQLEPGETLVLLDGTYKQTLAPMRAGTPALPITVRAKNPGKAIIDGEFSRLCIHINDYSFNGQAYYIFQDLNCANGFDRSVSIQSSYVTVRRCHLHNDYHFYSQAEIDALATPGTSYLTHQLYIGARRVHDVLIEDCVLSGISEKALKIFNSHNNIVRRCLVDQIWAHGQFDHNVWPWYSGIDLYHASDNIVENSVVFGTAYQGAIEHHGTESHPHQNTSENNEILGCIAAGAGMTPYGEFYDFGLYRPLPNHMGSAIDWRANVMWDTWLGGVAIFGAASGVVLKDVVSIDNAGDGFNSTGVIYGGLRLENVTIIDNDKAGYNKGQYNINSDIAHTVVNSNIQGTEYSGSGADITKRYTNGVKTIDGLWPWPMEERVREDLGYSVTNRIAALLPGQVDAIADVDRPIIGTDTTWVNFENAPTGQLSAKTIYLSNQGAGILIIDKSKLCVKNEVNHNAFTIINADALPTNIYPGDSVAVRIGFQPESEGMYAARLLIYPSNMGRLNFPHIVNLNGDSSNN